MVKKEEEGKGKKPVKEKEEGKDFLQFIKEKFPDIDLEKLEKEQNKLAKNLSIKDAVDFLVIDRIGACSNAFFGNKIISAIVVCDSDLQIIEQQYFIDKLKFPYVSGFRAYRELSAMLSCLNKINEKPEVIFVEGHGIAHPRLGLASQFSIMVGIPTVGVAKRLLVGQINRKTGDIILDKKTKKTAGKALQTKKGSNPIYISPGNLISINTAFELTKKFIRPPHKLPEPMYLVHRYVDRIRKELVG